MVLQTIEGTYEKGAVKLSGAPPAIDHAKVLVTFLTSDHEVDLVARGIPPSQAQLRARLAPFAEDWNRPEMDAYDAL